MGVLQKTTPYVSIIVVNYNTRLLVLKLLKKLRSDKRVEIIIIDNSDKQEIEGVIKSDYPGVRYFWNGRNIGFSAACNEGIRKSEGDWIAFINSDVQTTVERINALVQITQHYGYDAAVPRLVNKRGIIENNAGYFDPITKKPLNFIFLRPRFLNCTIENKLCTVDLATFAVFVFKRSLLKEVGLLDDKNYFMYFEDMDFSYRVKRSGHQILYVPSVSMMHAGGVTADKNSLQKSVNYRKSLDNYLIKNRGRYIARLNGLTHFFH